MSEPYEGDYECQMSEGPDDPCRSVATQVFREPYTPAGFYVYVCDEHAGHCRGFGYRRDSEAELRLEANKKLEAA
jgi:hypothetical protein